jgi:hypothetical protein
MQTNGGVRPSLSALHGRRDCPALYWRSPQIEIKVMSFAPIWRGVETEHARPAADV